MNILITAISQGLLWSIMAMGVYLTYRILHIADLTAEGSFPLGGAIASSLIVSGFSALAATFIAGFTGMLAGLITGLLYTKLKIPALISGILTMTGLYSINLRIMGRANISLIGQDTIFSNFFIQDLANNWTALIVGGIFITSIIFVLFLFFRTQIGYVLRSTGDNEQMTRSQGVDTDAMKILGLVISNALIALSGALIAQSNGFADISMGIGTIVIGLAAVTIGEVFFGNLTLAKRLMCVVLGSVVYRMIIALAINLNMNPNDLRLISAIILAIVLSSPTIKEKLQARNFGKVAGQKNETSIEHKQFT
ncbi:MAG: ABC transporter permease [Streptococcaceae bacterium]|jgi:putative ABC transport system permease protein|nr:ABC transporter permease [Streptococcaceae bacterium]